jgi:hypothetical protein
MSFYLHAHVFVIIFSDFMINMTRCCRGVGVPVNCCGHARVHTSAVNLHLRCQAEQIVKNTHQAPGVPVVNCGRAYIFFITPSTHTSIQMTQTITDRNGRNLFAAAHSAGVERMQCVRQQNSVALVRSLCYLNGWHARS